MSNTLTERQIRRIISKLHKGEKGCTCYMDGYRSALRSVIWEIDKKLHFDIADEPEEEITLTEGNTKTNVKLQSKEPIPTTKFILTIVFIMLGILLLSYVIFSVKKWGIFAW